MQKASIDLGTNTCLLLVADWDSAKSVVTRVISDECTIVRLGEGVDKTHELSGDAMARTQACLEAYRAKLQQFQISPDKVVCIATSQARDAKNGNEFFTKISREIGFKFRIISGDEEAAFTFIGGLLPGFDPSSSAVIDIGGGSTEIVAFDSGESVNVGAVRFTERYLSAAANEAVSDQQFWNCQEAIDFELEKLRKWRSRLKKGTRLIAVAGTATTLAAVHCSMPRYNAEEIDRTIMTVGDVHRLVEELKYRSPVERLGLVGMEKGREDVILAGAMILWRSMELLEFPCCYISSRGLRFGVFK